LKINCIINLERKKRVNQKVSLRGFFLLRDAFPVALTSSISKNTSQIKKLQQLKISSCVFACLFIIFTQSPSLLSSGLLNPKYSLHYVITSLQQYCCLTPFVKWVVALSLSYQG
jgi:hypothetical protein